MTLREWEKLSGRYTYIHPNGCVYLPDFSGSHRPELWQLDDYLVSSVTGGVIWLVERKKS